jgi:DeoR/GlpR family transcriptional regulator of sugar metabolism
MSTRVNNRGIEGIGRRQRICEILLEHGYVDVLELSKQLGVDSATIRRDLQRLEAEGAARRVHGGAFPGTVRDRQGVEIEFGLRMNFQAEPKRKIARRAAALIKSGDTVFLDAGTTAFMVAQELINHNDIVVATHSVAVINALQSARGITLIVVGGRLHPHTRSLIGPMTEEAVRSFQFRKMILATAGIDYMNRALTDCALEEVPIKRVAMSRSEQVILVADQGKFGKPSLVSLIPLAGVHTVVTDSAPPEAAVAVLRSLNIELITVE